MRRYLLLSITLFFSAHAYCAGQDTIPQFLEDIVIISDKNVSPLKNSDTRAMKIDMEFMHRLPKILGNADPLHYAQMLPGIQTNAEYDAGLHIQGCENSHNIISIEGVPVYNPSHLLGFFSTFNPSHFSRMSITKNATANDGYSCIGGILDMELHDEIPEKTNGEFSIGLISSQGTARIPIGKNAALFTSLRISYLNLLYSPWLRIDDGQLHYSFGDINATYLQKIGDNHTLHVDFYSGVDKAKLTGLTTQEYLNTKTFWGNTSGAIHWNYKSKQGTLRQSLYFTGYRNRLALTGNYKIKLPSEIYDIAYRSKFTLDKWETGLSVINHNTTPQSPEYANSSIIKNESNHKQHTFEGNIYAKYRGKLFNNIYYSVALKGDLYSDLKGYTHFALNPYAMIAYETWKAGRIEFCYSHQYQYLLNCGFTNLGMPVEFWISADANYKPQRAHNFLFSYKREIFNGKFDIAVEAYYKKLYNQVEYNGSPLDILNKEYSVRDVIICGDGHNYGANIILNKLSGKLTGWVSYSLGRALRKFKHYGEKWYPANHERIHEANIVIAYRLGKRFDIGGTFAYASGTPYTALKYLYIMSNNIVAEFGEHNACRLKDYIRLDISVNYDIIKREKSNAGINFSIYNVLCRKNEIYYGFRNTDNGFRVCATSFLTNTLPSISFYYKFH